MPRKKTTKASAKKRVKAKRSPVANFFEKDLANGRSYFDEHDGQQAMVESVHDDPTVFSDDTEYELDSDREIFAIGFAMGLDQARKRK